MSPVDARLYNHESTRSSRMEYEADEYRLMAMMKTVKQVATALGSLSERLEAAYEEKRSDEKSPEDLRRDIEELQDVCAQSAELLDAASEKLKNRADASS